MTGSRFLKTPIKERGQYPAILTSRLVDKELLIRKISKISELNRVFSNQIGGAVPYMTLGSLSNDDGDDTEDDAK